MKQHSRQDICINPRASESYAGVHDPLVAAEKITRRSFLRNSGTAGVAVGVVGLARFAQAQSGSKSGSGDETYFIVCIGDPGTKNRAKDDKTGIQHQNTMIPGNYQWQRVDSRTFDDPGAGPHDTLSAVVSASGPRVGAKALKFTITGTASAVYVANELFTGILTTSTEAITDQEVQLGTASSPKARPPLKFVHNPETAHKACEKRNTLQVRVDITSGTVIGTATDSGGPLVDWQIDAGTDGPTFTLKAPEAQTQTPQTRTGSFTWAFAVMTQAEYLKWCKANAVNPE